MDFRGLFEGTESERKQLQDWAIATLTAQLGTGYVSDLRAAFNRSQPLNCLLALYSLFSRLRQQSYDQKQDSSRKLLAEVAYELLPALDDEFLRPYAKPGTSCQTSMLAAISLECDQKLSSWLSIIERVFDLELRGRSKFNPVKSVAAILQLASCLRARSQLEQAENVLRRSIKKLLDSDFNMADDPVLLCVFHMAKHLDWIPPPKGIWAEFDVHSEFARDTINRVFSENALRHVVRVLYDLWGASKIYSTLLLTVNSTNTDVGKVSSSRRITYHLRWGIASTFSDIFDGVC